MTKFEKFCAIFIVVVLLILFGGIGYKIGYRIGYQKGYDVAMNEPYKADTVWKVDTITIDKPTEVIRWRDKLVFVPVTDSILIHHHDTTYIALEFEKVEYADSLYRLQIEGYRPQLNWIEVYPRTAYITNTITYRQRWGASITAGPAVLWNGKVHAGLGAAIGLSYNF